MSAEIVKQALDWLAVAALRRLQPGGLDGSVTVVLLFEQGRCRQAKLTDVSEVAIRDNLEMATQFLLGTATCRAADLLKGRCQGEVVWESGRAVRARVTEEVVLLPVKSPLLAVATT